LFSSSSAVEKHTSSIFAKLDLPPGDADTHRGVAAVLASPPRVVERLVSRRRVRSPIETLTDRERDVLQLMAEGRSNVAIGDSLYLGIKTVESHVRSILMKLDLQESASDNRRVLAVLTYLREG
jgi:DNA-binding NarL/FixJ family response regulator